MRNERRVLSAPSWNGGGRRREEEGRSVCERERCARVLRIFQARICAILDRLPTSPTRANERAIAHRSRTLHRFLSRSCAFSQAHVRTRRGTVWPP